jgi:putative DNA methylase
MTYRKKLIEVALPLDAINKASANEKLIRHGHPSTLHPWWSRKPLATCRAVLFASLVDDPSEHPEAFPTDQAEEQERERLFRLIEQLVQWENSNNEEVLAKTRAEILKSTGGGLPPVLDPFAGGGSIPLEAQRLGIEAQASDLNPVAVLINKALIEIPPKFAGCAPVNPNAQQSLMGSDWHGVRGLADDIRYYGKWMRDEAERHIGHLYPKVILPKECGGGEATVIAWLWVRTVTCPNPACGAQMPLTSKWWLSKKKSKEAWIEPHVDHTATPPNIRFTVVTGKGKPQGGTMSRQGASCIACKTSVPLSYIRTEAQARRMQAVLLAIVGEGQRGRVYLAPISEHEKVAYSAKPKWKPEELVTTPSHDVDRLPMYGMYTWGDAFTQRQLVALTTLSDLIQEAWEKILNDASIAGLPINDVSLNNGGRGANAYADAVATYLAFILNKLTEYI